MAETIEFQIIPMGNTSITIPESKALNETETKNSLAYTVAVATLLSLFVIIAVVGNLLVCAAVCTDRRLKRNSNFFIVSLAIADLIMSLLVMTFAIANDVKGHWTFGYVFCRIWISSDIMGSTASILSLCVISFDRYVHIKDPLRYETWMTGQRTILLIAGVWIMSFLISFIPTHLNWHTSSSTGLNSMLNTNLCIFELNITYALVSSLISFYVPCVIMVSIYVRLYAFARSHAEVIRKTYNVERFTTGACTKGSYRKSDHKAAVTLGIIMGVFLLCWFPFFVVNLIMAFCANCISKVLFQVLTWSGYVNSCLNPIIYSIFNTEFRDAFRRILCPRCWGKQHEQFYMGSDGAICNRRHSNNPDYVCD